MFLERRRREESWFVVFSVFRRLSRLRLRGRFWFLVWRRVLVFNARVV